MAIRAYAEEVNELIRKYNSLITQAKNQAQFAMKPTKEERALYLEAAEVCEAVMQLHYSERTEYRNWEERAKKCRSKAAELDTELKAPEYNVRRPETSAYTQRESSVPPVRSAAHTSSGSSAVPASDVKTDETENGGPGTRTLTTTKSGFSTYNAKGEHVTADVIESWFKPAPSHDMSAVSGMDEAKAELMKLFDDASWVKTSEAVHYMREYGIVFYGLPGTGKTFMIEAFISELMKKGYQYIRLTGGEIISNLVGIAEKTVEAVFQEAIDKSPCVIFIDEVDAVCKERSDASAKSYDKSVTVSFLQGYNKLVAQKKPVLLIVATNHLKQLDSAMVSRLKQIRVELPDAASRSRYFEQSLKGVSLEDGLSYDYMGEQTEGCSYRDLDRVKNSISYELKEIAKKSVGFSPDTDGISNKNSREYLDALDAEAERNVLSGKVLLTRGLFDRKNGTYKKDE